VAGSVFSGFVRTCRRSFSSATRPVYEGLPLSILDAMAARTLRAFEECLDAAS
jgi:hypothetical protein